MLVLALDFSKTFFIVDDVEFDTLDFLALFLSSYERSIFGVMTLCSDSTSTISILD